MSARKRDATWRDGTHLGPRDADALDVDGGRRGCGKVERGWLGLAFLGAQGGAGRQLVAQHVLELLHDAVAVHPARKRWRAACGGCIDGSQTRPGRGAPSATDLGRGTYARPMVGFFFFLALLMASVSGPATNIMVWL